MPAPAQQACESIGSDAILDMIGSGLSQTEIALSLGISQPSLNYWLHADPDRSARVKLAMSESAESWLDRGLRAVLSAPSDNAEINRARILEQHCARRAAIRNPRYRDNVSVEHTGQVELRSITRRIIDTALPMVEQLPPHAHTRAVLDSTEQDKPDSADTD